MGTRKPLYHEVFSATEGLDYHNNFNDYVNSEFIEHTHAFACQYKDLIQLGLAIIITAVARAQSHDGLRARKSSQLDTEPTFQDLIQNLVSHEALIRKMNVG